jgi:hypothetical protein
VELGTRVEPDTVAAEPSDNLEAHRKLGAQEVGLRKQAADPAQVRFRTPEEADRRAVVQQVLLRTTAEGYRLAAEVRPVLLSKGPAEERRVPSDRRRARSGLDRLVLLLL